MALEISREIVYEVLRKKIAAVLSGEIFDISFMREFGMLETLQHRGEITPEELNFFKENLELLEKDVSDIELAKKILNKINS